MKRVFFINLIISIFLFVFLIACNLEGDDAGSDNNDDEDDAAKITIMNGTINDTSKKAAASSGTQMIIAQSNQTGKIYYGFTDSEGNFKIEGNELDIQSETDNSFIVSVIGSDGKPEGTLAFDQPDASTIITGAKFSGDQINLGTIDISESSGILTPGSDGDNTTDIKDDNIKAQAMSGDLAGMSNFGKGVDSESIDLGGQNSKADGDYDGLPDVIDADDDGNGTIDDFESNFITNDGADSISAYIRGGVGLNIGDENGMNQYSENPIRYFAARSMYSIYVLYKGSDGKSITSAAVLGNIGPVYTGYLVFNNEPNDWWSSHADSDGNYPMTAAVESGEDVFKFSINFSNEGIEQLASDVTEIDAATFPGLAPGDTFVLKVTLSDGSVYYKTVMVNYTFRSVPQLRYYECGVNNHNFILPYDPSSDIAVEHGLQITIEGTDDLILHIEPPKDDMDQYITSGVRWDFQNNYHEPVPVDWDIFADRLYNDHGINTLSNNPNATSFFDARSWIITDEEVMTLDNSGDYSYYAITIKYPILTHILPINAENDTTCDQPFEMRMIASKTAYEGSSSTELWLRINHP